MDLVTGAAALRGSCFLSFGRAANDVRTTGLMGVGERRAVWRQVLLLREWTCRGR